MLLEHFPAYLTIVSDSLLKVSKCRCIFGERGEKEALGVRFVNGIFDFVIILRYSIPKGKICSFYLQ